MAHTTPTLSLIVLNWQSGHRLAGCLDSVFAGTLPPEHEVIVVDNGSADDSLARAERRFGDRIRVLRLERNLGQARGNNHGLAAARGEYVCTLNPDIRVAPDCLSRLVEFMRAHPRAGCCGPRIVLPGGAVETAAKRRIPNPVHAVSRTLWLHRLFPRHPAFAFAAGGYGDLHTTERCEASAGCCMMLRRAALDDVGAFDDGYFMYCEDLDWFVRAGAKGWEVWYVAEAVLEHEHAYSARLRKHRAVVDFHRSMRRFYRRHFAERHPAPLNALMLAGVWLRLGAVLAARGARGRW